MEVEIKLP